MNTIRYRLGHSNPPKDLDEYFLSPRLCVGHYHAVTVHGRTQAHLRLPFARSLERSESRPKTLEADPAGLFRLSGVCIDLVTPRGVLLNATLPSYPIALNA